MSGSGLIGMIRLRSDIFIFIVFTFATNSSLGNQLPLKFMLKTRYLPLAWDFITHGQNMKTMETISSTNTFATGHPSFFKRAKNEIVKIRKATLRTLTKCKQTGTFIAISSVALGEGQYVSSVEDIYNDGQDEVVVLKWYDKNNLASRTHVFLEEILSVKAVGKNMRMA